MRLGSELCNLTGVQACVQVCVCVCERGGRGGGARGKKGDGAN